MTKVDKSLFQGEHYLGRPADTTDLIIKRRLEIVRSISGFCGKELDLVDVGCGNGASMLGLASQMRSCTGLDIYEAHLQEFAKLKTEQHDNCEVLLVDIENEPFDRKFDRLICFEVIEHLRDEANTAKIVNLLKTGGLAAISVPNKWWIFETHGAKLPLLPWNRVPFFSWLPRPIHEKFANARIYTPSRISKLLESFGMQVLDCKYITAPMDVLPPSSLKRWLLKNIFKNHTTRIPFKAVSIFVLAKKLP